MWVDVGSLIIVVMGAGLTSGLELGTAFDTSNVGDYKSRVRRWHWGFILANAGLAIVLFYTVTFLNLSPFEGTYATALSVAIGYPVLLRVKLFEYKSQTGEAVPVGIEALYNQVRGYFFEEINKILIDAHEEVIARLMDENSLEALKDRAKTRIFANQLLGPKEVEKQLTFIRNTLSADTEFRDKKRALARFIRFRGPSSSKNPSQ